MPADLTTHSLRDDERELVRMAATALETIFRGDLIAILCQDKRGLFWTFRPGVEKQAIKVLQETDWKRMLRNAEEFVQ